MPRVLRRMSHVIAKTLLLVEDDPDLLEVLRLTFESEGFKLVLARDGEEALDKARRHAPDLLVLDLMLPGLDGLEICRRVRPDFRGPLLVLTARVEDVDEIVGLEVGADDYLAKPVRPRLLLARIHTLLRRARPAEAARSGPLQLGPLEVDLTDRWAALRGQRLSLTTAEFDLLALLARHAGRILSRDELYLSLRGTPYDGVDRSIDLRVSRLRSKLGADGPALLKSVRGKGYLLVTT